MKPILKAAVVGLGRIAWSDHLPGILEHPGFQLAAIVDPIAARCAETREQFGPCPSFNDMETMLRDVRPDVTVIASPTWLHAEQTRTALEYGSHVFCDKPAGLHAEEVKSMFRRAGQCRRKLMIYQPRRYFPEALAIRRLTASGKLGRWYGLKFQIDNYVRRSDWQALRRNGGGMLLNYGAHYLDLMQNLAGAPLVRAECFSERILSLGEAEDVVLITGRTRNGLLLQLQINQAAAITGPAWQIFGHSGAAVSDDGKHWRVRYCDYGRLAEVRLEEGGAAADRRYPADEISWHEESFELEEACPKAYQVFYRNLYEWITEDTAPLVSAAESVALAEVLDACRTGHYPVSIPAESLRQSAGQPARSAAMSC